MEIPVTLTEMKERHSELKLASTELWDLRNTMSDAGHEVMHELLFTERQGLYRAASGKVATTAEELAAQLDIFTLEAIEDKDSIDMSDDQHGQMLRSIRAGISGLSEPKGMNMEKFWTDYSSLDDDGRKLVQDMAKTLCSQTPVLKATG